MIRIDSSTTIPQTTPEAVFAYLSEPAHLSRMLPRMRDVELLERNATSARLATSMTIGERLGAVRCEGDVRWQEPHEIVFTVRTPISLETRWNLKANGSATDLAAVMFFDLGDTLGPMAQLVPSSVVGGMIADDLKQALAMVAAECSGRSLNERAVGA